MLGNAGNASFTISSLTAGGTIKFNGKIVSSDEKFTFNELKTHYDKEKQITRMYLNQTM